MSSAERNTVVRKEGGRTYAKWRDRKLLVAAIPIVLYCSYVVAAFLIGDKSCNGGGHFYFVFGFLSVPVLAGTAFVFGPMLHVMVRLVASLASVIVGVVVWDAAFSASGMHFICRLF